MYQPLFSPEDADLARLHWTSNRGYAYREKSRKERHIYSGRRVVYSAHRMVLERMLGRPLKPGEVCDHINHTPWDNRRENLRLTDVAGNVQNRPPRKDGRPRGVHQMPDGRWAAKVANRHIGCFDTMEAAGKAAAAKRYELGFLGSHPVPDAPPKPELDPRNTSGAKHVFATKSKKRWYAQVVHNKRKHYLGTFATQAEAVAAVKAKLAELEA